MQHITMKLLAKRRPRTYAAWCLIVLVTMLSACANNDPAVATLTVPVTDASPSKVAFADQQFPNVVSATASQDGNTWTFDVTISSPYDTPDRYADGWRVTGPDGKVFGEHKLTHDHAIEQPFTRTQTNVSIPSDVDTVTVEGRDQLNGYGGKTATVNLR